MCICQKYQGLVTIIALYVDDFYLIYNSNTDKTELLDEMARNFEIKDLGEAKSCLGMKLVRDWSKCSLILQQEDYIKSLLSKFDSVKCFPVKTPFDNKTLNEFENGEKITAPFKGNEKLSDFENGEKVKVPYQELVGCLLYLSVNTRPDISYAVSFLSQFNTCCNSLHWNQAKRLLAYLKATPKLGLKYVKAENPTFNLIGYADASWANNPADYRSYSGLCFTIDGSLISWESRKQKLTAQSSCESEYIAITEAVKESLYLNGLVASIFECGDQRVSLFNDNMSAITMAYSENYSARNRHYGARIQLVRDCVQDGSVAIEHMSTKIMPADILTKGLDQTKHDRCVINLNLSSD